VETKLIVKSFSVFFLRLIKIDNLPFLVLATISLVDDNGCGFNIFVTFNIKDSVILNVGDESTFLSALISEELPPS